MMTDAARRAHLVSLHSAISHSWRDIYHELDERIERLTRQLIDQNSDQLRGRIKELEDLKRLPQLIPEEIERLDSVLSSDQSEVSSRLDDG